MNAIKIIKIQTAIVVDICWVVWVMAANADEITLMLLMSHTLNSITLLNMYSLVKAIWSFRVLLLNDDVNIWDDDKSMLKTIDKAIASAHIKFKLPLFISASKYREASLSLWLVSASVVANKVTSKGSGVTWTGIDKLNTVFPFKSSMIYTYK